MSDGNKSMEKNMEDYPLLKVNKTTFHLRVGNGGDRTIGAIEAAQVADSSKRQKRKILHKR
jgi:hypothetical protein